MLKIGVIGLGHWGPNLVRNFTKLTDAKLLAVCDKDHERLKKVSSQFPNLYATDDPKKIMTRSLVDALVIATPTGTHYDLAEKSLENGIHTFVEKPLSTTVNDCVNLHKLASQNELILFVGHIFLYNYAVIKLKELINDGILGNVKYIKASRLNLGPIRYDVNTLWDLTSHDIYIVNYLLDSKPVHVNCQGFACLNNDIHDVCSVTIQYENDCMAFLSSSWLYPNKIRNMMVVGDRKMAEYNDMEPIEKIKVYDKGVVIQARPKEVENHRYDLREGNMIVPPIENSEPLFEECRHFVDSIISGRQPRSDGRNGTDAVRVLEAAEKSLKNGGERVFIRHE